MRACFGVGTAQVTDLDVTGKKLVESSNSHEKVLTASPQY